MDGFKNILRSKDLIISNTIKNKIKNDTFNSYPDFDICKKPMDSGLLILAILKKDLGLDETYFTSIDISEMIKLRGYVVKPKQITNAFCRSSTKIDKKTTGTTLSYMIMEPGIKYLHRLKNTDGIQTIYLDGTKQWTDYKQFSELIKETKGDVKVLDKFYSKDSLDTLSEFDKSRKIKFLTAKSSNTDKTDKFCAELKKFKHEFKKFEIRTYSKKYELHDRYIITSNFLILLGRGLQDIGANESFVVVFKTNAIKDIKSILESKFDERWNKSDNLK